MNNGSTICGGGYEFGKADMSLRGVEHFGGHGGHGGGGHGGHGGHGGYGGRRGYYGGNTYIGFGYPYPYYPMYDYGFLPAYDVVPFASNQTLLIILILLIALYILRH